MYRIYGTINAFRNCDESFTHGAMILTDGKGENMRKLRLFVHIDASGEMMVQVTGVFGFRMTPRFIYGVFHWSDIEDVLSGMNPHKAARELSGRALKEFVSLSEALGVWDQMERANRGRVHLLNRTRPSGPPQLKIVGAN